MYEAINGCLQMVSLAVVCVMLATLMNVDLTADMKGLNLANGCS